MQRPKIAYFVANNRLPAAGGWGDWAKDGLLLTYGPNTDEAMRRIAVYVDRILKGARPSDLPIERPTRFELTVNLKTAQALGIKLPGSIVAQADNVIE
jgi:putative ABC transport system substrate-binding protein